MTEAFNNFNIEFDNLEIGDFEKESLDNSELALNEVIISTNFKPTKKFVEMKLNKTFKLINETIPGIKISKKNKLSTLDFGSTKNFFL